VNSWTTGEKPILKKKLGDSDYIKLFMPDTRPELICSIQWPDSESSTSANNTQAVVLHRSFPLQRWTHVVLAFDSNVMDCYIDGKLVTSAPLKTVITMDGSANTLGGSGADMFMSGFIKKTSRATPDIAQSEYSRTKTMMQAELPKYNVDVSLVKNGEVTKQFSLI
jgi:hypothetical protein